MLNKSQKKWTDISNRLSKMTVNEVGKSKKMIKEGRQYTRDILANGDKYIRNNKIADHTTGKLLTLDTFDERTGKKGMPYTVRESKYTLDELERLDREAMRRGEYIMLDVDRHARRR